MSQHEVEDPSYAEKLAKLHPRPEDGKKNSEDIALLGKRSKPSSLNKEESGRDGTKTPDNGMKSSSKIKTGGKSRSKSRIKMRNGSKSMKVSKTGTKAKENTETEERSKTSLKTLSVKKEYSLRSKGDKAEEPLPLPDDTEEDTSAIVDLKSEEEPKQDEEKYNEAVVEAVVEIEAQEQKKESVIIGNNILKF